MRLEERWTLKSVGVVGAIGVIGAVLFFPSLYLFGLWLAPPRPVPEARPAPALLREALWARANGGPATELPSGQSDRHRPAFRLQGTRGES